MEYKTKEEYIEFFNRLKEEIDAMLESAYYVSDYERYLFHLHNEIEGFKTSKWLTQEEWLNEPVTDKQN